MMVNGFPSQRTTSPMGDTSVPLLFLKPMNLAAVSLIMKPAESVPNAREKSRPATSFQPIVLPNSYDTPAFGKSTDRPGSLPRHSKPPLVDHTSVTGVPDSASSAAIRAPFNSCRIASMCLCVFSVPITISNPARL